MAPYPSRLSLTLRLLCLRLHGRDTRDPVPAERGKRACSTGRIPVRSQGAGMSNLSGEEVQSSYDRIAGEYVERIYEELQHKPLDRMLLDRFAARVRKTGTACDIGCGPGHVARYL